MCARCKHNIELDERHVSIDWMTCRAISEVEIQPELSTALITLCDGCGEDVRYDVEAALSTVVYGGPV
jgi:hypothetical protein